MNVVSSHVKCFRAVEVKNVLPLCWRKLFVLHVQTSLEGAAGRCNTLTEHALGRRTRWRTCPDLQSAEETEGWTRFMLPRGCCCNESLCLCPPNTPPERDKSRRPNTPGRFETMLCTERRKPAAGNPLNCYRINYRGEGIAFCANANLIIEMNSQQSRPTQRRKSADTKVPQNSRVFDFPRETLVFSNLDTCFQLNEVQCESVLFPAGLCSFFVLCLCCSTWTEDALASSLPKIQTNRFCRTARAPR